MRAKPSGVATSSIRCRAHRPSVSRNVPSPLSAETITVEPVAVTVWKSVYGRVEARDTSVARARLGGTLVELGVTEGDVVTAGQTIGRIHDDKIAFQIESRMYRLIFQTEAEKTGFPQTPEFASKMQRLEDERFLDCYRRVGMQPFKEALYGAH